MTQNQQAPETSRKTDIDMIINALHDFNNCIYADQAETLFSAVIMHMTHLNQAVNGPCCMSGGGVQSKKSKLIFELNKTHTKLGSKGGMQGNINRLIGELDNMQKHVGTLKIIITKLNNLPKPFRNTANAVVGAPAIHVYPEPGTEVPLNLTDGPKRATHKENADKKPLKKMPDCQDPYLGPLGDFQDSPYANPLHKDHY